MNKRSRWRWIARWLSGVWMLVALCVASNVGAMSAQHGITLLVEAPPGMAAVADRLRQLDQARFQSLKRWIDWETSERDDQPIRVILSSPESPWTNGIAPWVAAYAVPRQRRIVLFPERIGGYPYDSLETVLTHEVAHILVGAATHNRSIPRWFDEGLAMVAAHTWGLDDHARLAWAVIAGNPVPFAEIDALFHRDRASAQRAYTLANAIVRYGLHAFGPRWPRRVLSRLAAGQPFDAAFAGASGQTLVAFERAFWAHQTRWKRWVPVAASSAVLWTGIALLALWVFRRQRRRAQLVQRQWQEEDEE